MTLTVGRCLLQQHLDRLGMTQVELAAKLKVTLQQIQYYVKEDFAKRRVTSLKTAKNIAEILNLEKIDDLYEWIEVGDNE